MRPGFYLVKKYKVEEGREEDIPILGHHSTEDDTEKSYNTLIFLELLDKDIYHFMIYIENDDVPCEEAKKIEFPNNPANKINSENILNQIGKMGVRVRMHIARHTSSLNVIENLASDRSIDVRCDVAENENTSANSLMKLAKDENFYVRLGVAKNKNTPKDTILKLLKDSSESVRIAALNNPNLPNEIKNLQNLFKQEKIINKE